MHVHGRPARNRGRSGPSRGQSEREHFAQPARGGQPRQGRPLVPRAGFGTRPWNVVQRHDLHDKREHDASHRDAIDPRHAIHHHPVDRHTVHRHTVDRHTPRRRHGRPRRGPDTGSKQPHTPWPCAHTPTIREQTVDRSPHRGDCGRAARTALRHLGGHPVAGDRAALDALADLLARRGELPHLEHLGGAARLGQNRPLEHKTPLKWGNRAIRPRCARR